MPEFNPTRAVLTHEDCDLHYWHQGSGPLIVFIPGGNGHGRQYNPIMAALSDRYTVATFDRRQMTDSVAKVNRRLNPPQQARDVRAIIEVLGFDKATVFGSSLGGILAFQFALDFPDMVEHVISHEAPTFLLLPDAAEAFEFLYRCQELYDAGGVEPAQAEFRKCLIGYDDEGVPKTMTPEPENKANHWAYEFTVLLGFCPSLYRLKENGTSVGVMRGVRSRDAWFARATNEQAKILDCPHMVVPGHHEGFQVELEEFLPHFFKMLETLEKRRSERS